MIDANRISGESDADCMKDRMSFKHLSILMAALAAILCYIVFVDQPHRRQATRQFQQMNAGGVTSIVLDGRDENFQLLRDDIIVRDRGQIEVLWQAIRDAKPADPSHPLARWHCQVHFVTTGRTWIAEVSSTDNCGVLLRLDGGNWLQTDSLGPLLEKIVIDKGKQAWHDRGLDESMRQL